MTTNEQRAAEVIYRALNSRYGDFSHHGETARALADEGLLPPELPRPDGSDVEEDAFWWTIRNGNNEEAPIAIGVHRNEVWQNGHRHTTETARETALALLAAIEYTEKEDDQE